MIDYSEGIYARLNSYLQEYVPTYEKVLIFDKDSATEIDGKVYPKVSLPFFECSLCFYVMPNGGLRCLKDRYDEYGRDNIFFGL